MSLLRTQAFTTLRRSISSRSCLSDTTQISFLRTLGNPTLGKGEQKLPFKIPSKSWLRSSIGNTPLVHLHDDIFAKLEGHNPGGSVKDRTLSSIVLSLFKTGDLKKKGDTLVLVTSGSAGMSLTHIHEALKEIPEFDLNVVVVMPKIYAKKEIPAEIIALPSTTVYEDHEVMIANTTGENQVPGGSVSVLLKEGVFMDVLADVKSIAAKKNWVMLDQHYDANSMDGHRSTALELLLQCPGLTDVVCATGTGATSAGLRRHLPNHIKVHSRPAVSGSIDGLSDVNRYNNFCKTDMLEGYKSSVFDADVAKSCIRDLETIYNVHGGPSSGATYWLARQIKETNPNAKIAFICADGKLSQEVLEHEHKTIKASNLLSYLNPPVAATTRNPPLRNPFFEPVLSKPTQVGRKMALMNCYSTFKRS